MSEMSIWTKLSTHACEEYSYLVGVSRGKLQYFILSLAATLTLLIKT
jgi:hypothetical protein